ncbi:MAG: LysR family transcriptional regulator [Burkholderiaceae bacterium]
MKKLDVAALEAFIAAVEEKSLSKASLRENLVTSAISRRIADLESYLGKTLLQRHGRGVEPTPVGALLYQNAKSILRNIKLTEEAVNDYDSHGNAKIRLMSNPSAILQFLPNDIARFLKRRKNISIDLVESHSYDTPRCVAEHQADIGVYHAEQPATGVISHLYRTDRVGLVVPGDHPLATRSELYLEEALEYDLLGYFPRHSLDQFLRHVGSALSRPPNVKLQVSNFETRCQMIREGLGIGVVPERIAQNYLQQMNLKLLRLNDSWAQRQFFLCTNDKIGGNPAASALVASMLEKPA